MSTPATITLAVLAGGLISSALECIKLYRTSGIGPDERRERILWSVSRAMAAAMIVRVVIIFIS